MSDIGSVVFFIALGFGMGVSFVGAVATLYGKWTRNGKTLWRGPFHSDD